MALKDKLDIISKLRKEWDGLQPVSKENDYRLWQKFRLKWNYNSNHIEGNTLTYGETILLLINGKATGDHEKREFDEMEAHDVAIKIIKDWSTDATRELTETDIRSLNKIILVKPFWKEAITFDGQPTRRLIKIGDYKEFPNSVRLKNGEIFHYAPPQETPRLMRELIEWYRGNKDETPIIHAAELHYNFIKIHPFDDGNGRIARLLVNYVLMQHGFPPIIVKSADKEGYLTALQKADAGDREAFQEYMAEQLIWSLEIAIKAAKGESIEEEGDLDKKITTLERELSRIDEDKEVKQQLDKNLFFEIYNSWFSELIKEVVPVVQRFNHFFTGTSTHFISASNGLGFNVTIPFRNDTAEEILKKGLIECEKNMEKLNQNDITINFQTFYGTFIKGGLDTFGCNYGFEIKLELIKYVILVDEFTESNNRKRTLLFEKLYHKRLTNDEIKIVARKLGNAIFQHIDFNSKKLGLI